MPKCLLGVVSLLRYSSLLSSPVGVMLLAFVETGVDVGKCVGHLKQG